MSTRTLLTTVAACAMLAACAGRDPHPVAVVQPMDNVMDCTAIQASLAADASQKVGLDTESDNTTAKNVAFGAVGVVLFWPALFAMDTKDAAGVESKALVQRDNYLRALAAQRCGQPPVAYQPSYQPTYYQPTTRY
jgi:hypothetical protein